MSTIDETLNSHTVKSALSVFSTRCLDTRWVRASSRHKSTEGARDSMSSEWTRRPSASSTG
jgi:hypothetical protein